MREAVTDILFCSSTRYRPALAAARPEISGESPLSRCKECYGSGFPARSREQPNGVPSTERRARANVLPDLQCPERDFDTGMGFDQKTPGVPNDVPRGALVFLQVVDQQGLRKILAV